jgi:hypothetical protein
MDPVSSSRFRRGEGEAPHHASFEETYPRYEFAELVRLTLAAAAWLVGMRRRVERRRSDVSRRPSPGEMNPAE